MLKPARVSLEPGDMFFFYSDGIPEAMNSRQKEFGFDRLKRALAVTHGTSRATVKDCLRSVRTFTGNEPPSDDITLVAVRTSSGAKNR